MFKKLRICLGREPSDLPTETCVPGGVYFVVRISIDYAITVFDPSFN